MSDEAIALRQELLMIRGKLAEYKERESEIVAKMAIDNSLSGKLDYLGSRYSITLVRSTSTKVDDKGIRKALSSEQWDAISDRKLNNKKLEKAIDDGTIQAEVISDFITVVDKAPYVRVTELKGSDE